MKKNLRTLFYILLVIMFCSAAAASTNSDRPKVATFQLKDLKGKRINFKKLEGKVLVIKFNDDKVGAKLVEARKFLSGNLLLFNLGGYEKDVLLGHLKKHEKISIKFIDGNGIKASDYFDMRFNEWSIAGISEAFENAYRACSR